tara:strand:+ start:1461 stop:2006 length:546 start_codon:yes stop_codon:yes gene_type:complete
MIKLEENEAYMYFKNNGYDIFTPDEFKKLDFKTYYENEAFHKNFNPDMIDYELNDITEKINEDGTREVINYIHTKKNLTYIDWYERKDWNAGMDWYEKHFSFIPFIEELSLILVKNDLKGKMKLDKYEITDLKQIVKRINKHKKQIEVERNKKIKELKRKEKIKTTFRTGSFIVKFDEDLI